MLDLEQHLRRSLRIPQLLADQSFLLERTVIGPILLLELYTFRMVLAPTFSRLSLLSWIGPLLIVPHPPQPTVESHESMPLLRRDLFDWLESLEQLKRVDLPELRTLLLATNEKARVDRATGGVSEERLLGAVLDCVLCWKEIRLRGGRVE